MSRIVLGEPASGRCGSGDCARLGSASATRNRDSRAGFHDSDMDFTRGTRRGVSPLAVEQPARSIGLEEDRAVWQQEWLMARALTIASGNSEIQRNTIAQRLLGLPHWRWRCCGYGDIAPRV